MHNPDLSDELELWRYFSFSKFIALLSTEALHFARCDTFADIFDGALGSEKDRDAVLGFLDGFGETFPAAIVSALMGESVPVQEPPLGSGLKTVPISISDQMEALLREHLKIDGKQEVIEDLRTHYLKMLRTTTSELFNSEFESTFISCWHGAAHESEAMWRLYSKDATEGVAVKTSVRRLVKALPTNRELAIYPVEYQDNYHLCLTDKPMKRFFTKRLAFEHEKEVRIILTQSSPQKERGFNVPVNLTILIKEVRVSFNARAWFALLVLAVCEKFGIRTSVLSSTLVGIPLFR